jgi:hypothetical protein
MYVCVSSRVIKPACGTQVAADKFAPATDQSIEKGLSMSMFAKTRKMVNYACEGAPATDQSIEKGLSMNIFGKTRKMVNYACEGPTREKLSWRLVAILLCKSFGIFVLMLILFSYICF